LHRRRHNANGEGGRFLPRCYEPVSAGGLENAGAVEDFLGVIFAVAEAGTGRFWYRFAPPERF
jgi:hypothetical protein